MYYTTNEVKFMANRYSQNLESVSQQIVDAHHELAMTRSMMADDYGEFSVSVKRLDIVMKHIENALRSLNQLDRVIPSDYIDESSKLESRIKRLERLMK